MIALPLLLTALMATLPVPDALEALSGVEGHLGVVMAQRDVELTAAQNGVIATIDVRVGDRVTAGQQLFCLDQELIQLEVDMARASLLSAQAESDRARVALEQIERQYQRKRAAAEVLSTEEVERARTSVELARAEKASSDGRLAEQRARMAALETSLRLTRGTAPFAGVVASCYADVGGTVRALSPVLRLIADAPPFVRFAVPPSEISHYRREAQVHVTVPGAASTLTARVRSVAPEVDAAIDMILVEADLSAAWDRPEGGVRVGMVVRVDYRATASPMPRPRASSDR